MFKICLGREACPETVNLRGSKFVCLHLKKYQAIYLFNNDGGASTYSIKKDVLVPKKGIEMNLLFLREPHTPYRWQQCLIKQWKPSHCRKKYHALCAHNLYIFLVENQLAFKLYNLLAFGFGFLFQILWLVPQYSSLMGLGDVMSTKNTEYQTKFSHMEKGSESQGSQY